MEPTKEHIDRIRLAFSKMETKLDLLYLLNEVKPFVYGKKAVSFDLKQLSYYTSPKLRKQCYILFNVKKKSGGYRQICAPNKGLKSIQKTLAFLFQCVYKPHRASMGFVWGKSIVTNAQQHVGSRYVYNIDLKDFFSSIDQARVWKCLQLRPFNLNTDNSVQPEYITWEEYKEKHPEDDKYIINLENKRASFTTPANEKIYLSYNLDIEKQLYILTKKNSLNAKKTKWLVNDIFSQSRLEIANIIASVCCVEQEVERKDGSGKWVAVKKNVLPQGAPTSPVLSNVVCSRLDYLLAAVAKRFGLKYTRYADDITFSSMHNVYQLDGLFIKELHRIINQQGFHMNDKKTRLQKDGYRKEVTGLLVNHKVNVQKRYIKQLRMWLYYWERYGYSRASGFFEKQYLSEKGHVKEGQPNMMNVIAGKLEYFKMVKGDNNNTYLNLAKRFKNLNKLDKNKKRNNSSKGDHKSDDLPKGFVKVTISSQNLEKGARLKKAIIIPKGEYLPYKKVKENIVRDKTQGSIIDLTKHKPIEVTKFLLSFRSSEGLKFLTHDYDKPNSVFRYEEVLMQARKEFEELSAELIIPSSLWARVNQYAFSTLDKAWMFNKKSYYTNWNSLELKDWIDKNPTTHPINSSKFEKDLIAPFKKSIEIKAPDLENIVKTKLAENLRDKYTSFSTNFIDLDKANFYTNVDAFQVGISYLFKAIKQRFDNSKQIKIVFSRKSDSQGRKRIIKIIHVDSSCNRPLDKDIFQGDLLEAEKAFFGICDWSIISKSPDPTVNQLNILFDINSNIQPKEKIDDSLIEGFTHVLTFYA